MNESQGERESCPDSSLSELRQFHSQPACLWLSSTELRKEQISPGSDPVYFIHWKDLFVRTTRSQPTQHYTYLESPACYITLRERIPLAGSGMVGTNPFYGGQCRGKASFGLTLVTEAVRCEAISRHIQANTNCSQHIVVKTWSATTVSSVLLYLGQNIGIYVDFYNQQQSYLRIQLWATTLWNSAVSPQDTPNFTLGMNAPLSDISYNRAVEVGLW